MSNRKIVKTHTATYWMDCMDMTLIRTPNEESLKHMEFRVDDLRKDHEPIPFELVKPIEIGKDMLLILKILDNVETLRRTTPVTSIEEV